MVYQDAYLLESGVRIGDVFIPEHWIKGDPKLASEFGHYHQITLTVHVNNIEISGSAHFEIGEYI